MRVVHLLGALMPSGMERMLVSGAPHFVAAGLESVLVGQGDRHPYAGTLRAAGYPVRVIPEVRTPRGAREWAALVTELRPDVIHIHSELAFSSSVLLARRAAPRAGIIRTFHSFFDARGRWGVKRRAQAIASDWAVDAFVALNQDMAEHERRFGRHCEVIGNWVDEQYFAVSREPADVDVVMVGNCSMVKNHRPVLEAARQNGWTVAHLGAEVHADDEELRAIDALQRDGLLAFRGVGDPVDWLPRSRVFVISSMYEGFAVSLAEALAAGSVCLSSDIPGTRWARRYPMTIVHAGMPTQGWDASIARALEHASTQECVGLADSQREQARDLLHPARGVRMHTVLYENAVRWRSGPATRADARRE